MMGAKEQGPSHLDFVEIDPTGIYGRYNDILGKGASKTVYRAFYEYEGIEVAWNQVKLHDFLQSPENLERLYCEIHLLKTLNHKNIMKLYTSWVDTSQSNINFITELFTSGTLRQYRQKHKKINIRAVKHWCRQILNGLLYLHSHDPPIIHRDLKCDNIFINGNHGEVKIGDLGLAAILRNSHAVHCVGTPEFMAPEVYEEEYNELVDIYSFGMCVLEMFTFEYPYSECTHPVQIYKKVISGIKPDAFHRLKDPQVRQFVEKCLAPATKRRSARELLNDPFLQIDDPGLGYDEDDFSRINLILRQPSLDIIPSNGCIVDNEFSNSIDHLADLENTWGYDTEVDLLNGHHHQQGSVDIAIMGKLREDGNIFLRLKILDKNGDPGHVRNVYFLFDIEADTSLIVATEMVAELDILDCDVTGIADMIDKEVASLVPHWKPGPGIEDAPGDSTTTFCKNSASNVSSCGLLSDSHSTRSSLYGNMNCHCVEMNRRVEEITFQDEASSNQSVTQGAPKLLTKQLDALHASLLPSWSDHHNECEQFQVSVQDEKVISVDESRRSDFRTSTRQSCLGPLKQQSFRSPLAAGVKRMKSFHLGRHNSFHIPSDMIDL